MVISTKESLAQAIEAHSQHFVPGFNKVLFTVVRHVCPALSSPIPISTPPLKP